MTLASLRSRMLPATDRRLRPSPANLSPRPKSLLRFGLEWLTIGWMTANRLLLAAIAALALTGAALAQETDSDVASTGEQGFSRFASLAGIKKRRATLRSGSEHWWGPTRPRDALSPTTVSLASRKR